MPHFYIMDKSHHLAHYGHKGQKWGVRNYQNYDGTYTQAGLERYWPNSKHGTRGNETKERGGSRKGPEHFKSWEEYEKVTLDLARKSDSKQTAVGLDGKTRTYEIKTVSPHILDRDASKALKGVHDYDQAVGKLKDLDQVKYFASMLQVEYDKVFDHLLRDTMANKITDETKSLMQDHVNKFNNMLRICAPSEELWDRSFYKPDVDGPYTYSSVLWDAAEGINRQKYHETHPTNDAPRGGKTRGGMMTDMADTAVDVANYVPGKIEKAINAMRSFSERQRDKVRSKEEAYEQKREASRVERAVARLEDSGPYSMSDSARANPERNALIAKMNKEIANGADPKKVKAKYFDQAVNAALSDKGLVGNKQAEQRIRDAWSNSRQSLDYEDGSRLDNIQRQLKSERAKIENLRSKVYDENYNIVDPAAYKKYMQMKKDYRATKRSLNDDYDLWWGQSHDPITGDPWRGVKGQKWGVRGSKKKK